jgi:hypothetical protein
MGPRAALHAPHGTPSPAEPPSRERGARGAEPPPGVKMASAPDSRENLTGGEAPPTAAGPRGEAPAPKRMRPLPLISLTLLDGTSISILPRRVTRPSRPDQDAKSDAKTVQVVSVQLTARDLRQRASRGVLAASCERDPRHGAAVAGPLRALLLGALRAKRGSHESGSSSRSSAKVYPPSSARDGDLAGGSARRERPSGLARYPFPGPLRPGSYAFPAR